MSQMLNRRWLRTCSVPRTRGGARSEAAGRGHVECQPLLSPAVRERGSCFADHEDGRRELDVPHTGDAFGPICHQPAWRGLFSVSMRPRASWSVTGGPQTSRPVT